MTELGIDPIGETTYDNVVTHDGNWDGGSTTAPVSGLNLLDLSGLTEGVLLVADLRLRTFTAEARAVHLTGDHRFYNMDDAILGSVSDTVVLEATPNFGYGTNDRIPVIDAGDGRADRLSIMQGALSDAYSHYELNMETGMLTGTDEVLGTASFGRYLNFKYLYFFDDAAISIQGTADANVIDITNAPKSIVNAGAGWDMIYSGAGDDTIDGGDGDFDSVHYIHATSGVSVYLEYQGRDVGGGLGADYLTNIEVLVGSDHGDRLVGDETDNFLNGDGGDDTLKGKEGDDYFEGKHGADLIWGGEGADSLYGGADADSLLGGSGSDTLEGQSGDDFLYGGRDNDTLYGGYGDDRLRGNRNNDELNGGDGQDTLFGGGQNDTLYGSGDSDRLYGENGNDVLNGGAGDDFLRGGDGADVFVYNLTGFDRVKDFENGIDQLDLSEIAGLTTFADVLAVAQDRWGGVVLDFGNDNVLFVENMDIADFDASDVTL